MYCILFTIYILKLFGWIDNIIKLSSYILLILFISFFLIKNFKNFKINEIVIAYFVIFIFIFIFIFNSVIQGFSSYSSQTIGMYLYNFGLALFSFLAYKNINFVRLVKLFSIFIILSMAVDIIFLYDFYIAHYELGFIKHIEQNVSTVYYGRGCGFFSDPTAHATILLSYLPLVFLSYKYFNLSKTMMYMMFLLSFIAMILSTSKAGITLYFIEVLFLSLFISKKRFYKKLFLQIPIILFFLLSMVIVLILYLYYMKVEMIIDMVNFFVNPNEAKTLTERYYTYNIALSIINNNPFTGIGFGNPQKIIGLSIHNSLLQLFSEQGIIGMFFLIYLFIIFPYFIYTKLHFSYLKIIFIISNVVFFIKALIVDVFHTHEIFIYLFIMGTLYQASIQIKKEKMSASSKDRVIKLYSLFLSKT